MHSPDRRLVLAGLGSLIAFTVLAIVLMGRSAHDPNQALRHADRVMMIRDGQALASGRADDLLTPDRLEQLYGVPIETLRDADGRVAFLPG